MSLRLKTILGVALIEAMLLIVLLGSAFRYMNKTNEESLINYAQTTSNLLANATKDAVISYDLATAESYTSEFIKNNGVVYVRIFDANETLLAAKKQDSYIASPFSNDLQLKDVKDSVFDIRSDITEGGIAFGHIEIGISTEKITQEMAQIKRFGVSIAAFEMGLVALFSAVLGIYLTKQLRALDRATKKVAAGDLSHTLSIKGKDEVANLANSFNRMILSLRETEKKREEYRLELELINKTLEERVEKRTAQLKEKNRELADANEDIKKAQSALLNAEKMASLGEMAAGVAHEVNNPIGFITSNLNSLGSYTETYGKILSTYESIEESIRKKNDEALSSSFDRVSEIKKELDFEFIKEDIEELISDSKVGADRVKGIVQGLKAFSHIDQSDRQHASINECIKETIKIANHQTKDKCTIETHFGDIPSIECSPGKLNQVFMNLIINASQAVNEEGRVSISTKATDDSIEVSVRDNGCGISKDNIKKIFDPFFTTRKIGDGTGLGLSISHGIVKEHGGDISLKSRLGEGTEFTIILPIGSPLH